MARRTRRGKSHRDFWTKSRIRRVVAVAVVAWMAVAVGVPLTTYGSLLGTEKLTTSGTYTLAISGLPPVNYSAVFSYSTDGAFSVGAANPIYMTAHVYNVNVSNFANMFTGIGLLYQDIPIEVVNGKSMAVFPVFHPAGQGSWDVQGKVVFAHQINFTGPVLAIANPPKNVSASVINSEVNSQVNAYNYPFPALRPQSYTNQLSAKEWDLRYAAIASSLLLVLLLPAFYRALLPPERREGPD